MARGADFTVEFDTSGLMRGLDELENELDAWMAEALEEMANTLLVLSTYEVPHDTGQLQSTGHIFPKFDEVVAKQEINVAYDTEYAAYQHEGVRRDGTHEVKQYQKGRKKKYLEDPLKINMSRWSEKLQQVMKSKLQGKL